MCVDTAGETYQGYEVVDDGALCGQRRGSDRDGSHRSGIDAEHLGRDGYAIHGDAIGAPLASRRFDHHANRFGRGGNVSELRCAGHCDGGHDRNEPGVSSLVCALKRNDRFSHRLLPCCIEIGVGEIGEGLGLATNGGHDHRCCAVAVHVGCAERVGECTSTLNSYGNRDHVSHRIGTVERTLKRTPPRPIGYVARMDLHELSDRTEINDLLVRYSEALNRADWETWTACFTADAHLDYTTAGGVAGSPAEAVAWLAPTMAMFDMRIHRMANVQICFDGADTAAIGSQYNTVMRIPGAAGDAAARPTYIEAAGWYDDVVVRTASGWLLSKRAERIAYTRI